MASGACARLDRAGNRSRCEHEERQQDENGGHDDSDSRPDQDAHVHCVAATLEHLRCRLVGIVGLHDMALMTAGISNALKAINGSGFP